MIDGRFNSIYKSGVIVENPTHTVRLAGSEERLGGHVGGTTVEEVANYLLHRTKGIPLGELSDYFEEHGRPSVILEEEGRKIQFDWDESKEDYKKAWVKNGV